MFKSRISRQIEYNFQKSRVTGPWDHKVSVSAKKVKKKFHVCVPLRAQGKKVRVQCSVRVQRCLLRVQHIFINAAALNEL